MISHKFLERLGYLLARKGMDTKNLEYVVFAMRESLQANKKDMSFISAGIENFTAAAMYNYAYQGWVK